MPKSLFGEKLTEIKKSAKITHFYQILGLSKGTYSNYVNGSTKPDIDFLMRLSNCVARKVSGKLLDMNWLIDDFDNRPGPIFVEAQKAPASNQPEKPEENDPVQTPTPQLPPGNAIRRKGDQDAAHKVTRLITVGSAAALERGASLRQGFDDPGIYWDRVEETPESAHLVKIRGDSMEPLIMHGQSVVVGTEYRTEFGDAPRNRELVVAEVTVQDNDIGGMDGEWEGVHCKRVQDAGDLWLFTSVNPCGETFSVVKDNCRLWHVLAIYMGEKGRIPEED